MWCLIASCVSNATSTQVYIADKTEKTIITEIHRLSNELHLDENLVKEIIRCEGTLYPTTPNVNYHKRVTGYEYDGRPVIYKIAWSRDWGPLQINDFYHEQKMRERGLDIHNDFDSLQYGMEMMAKDGTEPWKASKSCWQKPAKSG